MEETHDPVPFTGPLTTPTPFVTAAKQL